MKAWILAVTCLAALAGCKRAKVEAVPAAVQKSYDPKRDRTTLSTAPISRATADGTVSVRASFSYAGTTPPAKPVSFAIEVASKPTGRAVDGQWVPMKIEVDGTPPELMRGQEAMTFTAEGTRYYLAELNDRDFLSLTSSPFAKVTVNDVAVTLTDKELESIGRLRNEAP